MAMLAAVAGIASAGIGMFGALQQGAAAKAAGEYQRNADIAQGKTDVAASQRQGIEHEQQADLTGSRQIALAAASGGGVQTPSIRDIYSQTAGRGAYQNEGAIYQGKQRQMALQQEGDLAKWKGDVAEQGSWYQAAGAGLGGLSKVNWTAAGNSFDNTFG